MASRLGLEGLSSAQRQIEGFIDSFPDVDLSELPAYDNSLYRRQRKKGVSLKIIEQRKRSDWDSYARIDGNGDKELWEKTNCSTWVVKHRRTVTCPKFDEKSDVIESMGMTNRIYTQETIAGRRMRNLLLRKDKPFIALWNSPADLENGRSEGRAQLLISHHSFDEKWADCIYFSHDLSEMDCKAIAKRWKDNGEDRGWAVDKEYDMRWQVMVVDLDEGEDGKELAKELLPELQKQWDWLEGNEEETSRISDEAVRVVEESMERFDWGVEDARKDVVLAAWEQVRMEQLGIRVATGVASPCGMSPIDMLARITVPNGNNDGAYLNGMGGIFGVPATPEGYLQMYPIALGSEKDVCAKLVYDIKTEDWVPAKIRKEGKTWYFWITCDGCGDDLHCDYYPEDGKHRCGRSYKP